MDDLSDIALQFRQRSLAAMRFDSFMDVFYETLMDAGVDGVYYWTYDKGALPTLLKGVAQGTGIVAAARGPMRLKALETLYWRKKWYEHDPSLQATEERTIPFRTRDVTPRNGKRLKIFDYLDALQRFGITEDLFVPIHTPRRVQALYFFTLGDPAKSVLSGQACIAPLTELSFLFGNGIADFCRKQARETPETDLTIREHECLRLTAQGFSTQEIGDALGLKPRTAKFHVENMMRKLGARTRAQAVGNAVRSFILTD
ncbi:LuxR C-terminal-related transcriptional regulator [Thalassococcus sp. S3]|uniref:LuxR C-terminal-related transcriptional regulator n=1 Tax=Thalassococcus sp. S3 TaxID=2017482 RepID=UPI001024395F|nr:LuxR C-terminal-related transcriptional regulator [Thalassococcus sp. S3]QBF32525.1 hypothetical protein CFI11_15055 [Thalassococcus sp. S3]